MATLNTSMSLGGATCTPNTLAMPAAGSIKYPVPAHPPPNTKVMNLDNQAMDNSYLHQATPLRERG
jgi:hypothetical protein